MLNKKIFLALFFLSFCCSCVEMAVVGSVAGISVATREKRFSDTVSDTKIAAELVVKLTENGLKSWNNSVEVTVNEGRVLLVGIVRDESKIGLANSLAWKIEGVKEVIDEVQEGRRPHLTFRDATAAITDSIITGQIELAFLMASDIATMNYKITTVNKNVYLIGTAYDREELNKAIQLASQIRGVKKIVNHVILSDDSRRRR